MVFTNYGHSERAFFKNLEIWTWADILGLKCFEAFGVFSAGLSVPILVLWVPCPCFPLFNHYFFKKSLYPTPKYLFGSGILIWTAKNLRINLRVPVIRGSQQRPDAFAIYSNEKWKNDTTYLWNDVICNLFLFLCDRGRIHNLFAIQRFNFMVATSQKLIYSFLIGWQQKAWCFRHSYRIKKSKNDATYLWNSVIYYLFFFYVTFGEIRNLFAIATI